VADTVDPLGLVNKAGRWYVVAVDQHGGRRVHRIDRLVSVEITPASFVPPDDFELGAAWTAWAREFEASRPVVQATIDVRPDAVDELPKALGDHVAALLAGARPDRDGNRRITVQFFSREAAVHQLTGAGHLARVVSPDELRDEIVERARRVLADLDR
jgi:predicted DNA-binding transcriptional regulator YafY